ncbi:MAG: hypothetical protein O3C10_08370 [Chloroflexi bacterium]|nr:hypothetical protein [Chloroflexota bacterium]
MQWTEFFGALAEREPDDEFATGRPGGLSPDLADRIADDIAQKLELNPDDTLLDYGSGPGVITRRLAQRVARTTASDTPISILERGRTAGGEIDWVELDPGATDPPWTTGSFTKVLSYNNARTYSTHQELRGPIDTLCAAVAPGGTVLFGDIPDRERTGQWESGERGRDENRTVWIGRLERRALDMERDARNMTEFMARLQRLGIEPPKEFGERHPGFMRDVVTRIFRENGGEVSVVTQPLDFPNAHTCVDYVVRFQH